MPNRDMPGRPGLGRAIAAAAFFAALAVAVPPGSARADAIADAVRQLDPTVQDVRIAGTWEKEGRKGVYRIVVARSGVPQPAARLFVQWIATGVDGSLGIDHAIEIGEMAALKLDIADFVAETDPDGLSIFVEVVDPSQDTDQSYELFIEDDGTYRFGPASN